MSTPSLHLAVALGDGLDDEQWPELVERAEQGLLDFVGVGGTADTVGLATRLAPHTSRIGLVPNARPTAPVGVADAVAKLEDACPGRVGWQVEVAGPEQEVLADVEAVQRHLASDGAGRPVTVVPADDLSDYRVAARTADVVVVTPHDLDEAYETVTGVRDLEAINGREEEPALVLVDLVVVIEDDGGAAVRRLADHGDGAPGTAAVFAGAADKLADLLLAWQRVGVDGYLLRPASPAHDLGVLVDSLVPALQERGAFRQTYEQTTLRGLLGLDRRSADHTVARNP